MKRSASKESEERVIGRNTSMGVVQIKKMNFGVQSTAQFTYDLVKQNQTVKENPAKSK